MHRRLRSLPPEPDCIVRIFIRGFCFAIRGIFSLHRPSNTENAHGWHSRTHGSIQLPFGDGYGSTRGGVGFGPNPNRCNKPRRSNPKWANEASRSAVAVASSRFPTNGRLSGMNSIMPAVGSRDTAPRSPRLIEQKRFSKLISWQHGFDGRRESLRIANLHTRFPSRSANRRRARLASSGARCTWIRLKPLRSDQA
jgi:hypothetical protein